MLEYKHKFAQEKLTKSNLFLTVETLTMNETILALKEYFTDWVQDTRLLVINVRSPG